MKQSDFLSLKKGDFINLPMDQVREIDSPANTRDMPWNQVATTTAAWFDARSNTMTFFVDRDDAISISKESNAKDHRADQGTSHGK
jgi:hypothetical protein